MTSPPTASLVSAVEGKGDLPPDPHFIRRGGGWFRPAAAGYTLDITEAGLFSGAVARDYKREVEGITIHPVASVRVDLANAIVRARRALAMAEAAYEAACGEPAPTASHTPVSSDTPNAEGERAPSFGPLTSKEG